MIQQIDYSRTIVRRASSADIQAIFNLAEGTPTSPRWQTAAYDTFCREPKPEDVLARALFTAWAQGTHSSSGEIIGFAAFSAVAAADGGECDLENMIVANEWRRMGIGRRLLHAGSLWCRTWRPVAAPASTVDFQVKPDRLPDAVLWLEVRASNGNAIAFYEDAGFTRAGGRPKYYAQPLEDAVLMKRTLA